MRYLAESTIYSLAEFFVSDVRRNLMTTMSCTPTFGWGGRSCSLRRSTCWSRDQLDPVIPCTLDAASRPLCRSEL